MGIREWLQRLRGRKIRAPRQGEELLSVGRPQEAQDENIQKRLRSLENQLFDWLFNTDNLTRQPLTRTGREVLRSLKTDWKDERYRLDTLPRRPSALPQLLHLLNLPDATREDIVRAITQDAALTDSVLRTANSAFYRTSSTPVASLDRAVFILGLRGVRNALSTALMQPLMTAGNESEKVFADSCWQWGLACARGSELIAKRNGADAGAFFLLGLLPALGHLLIYRDLEQRYRDRSPARLPEATAALVAIRGLGWRACVNVADAWQLPPRYHAHILEALRPSPVTRHTPLNDGMILATVTQLRSAGKKTVSNEELGRLLEIDTQNLSTLLRKMEAPAAADENPETEARDSLQ